MPISRYETERWLAGMYVYLGDDNGGGGRLGEKC